LTLLSVESCCDDNTKVVEHFVSFPESPILLVLDILKVMIKTSNDCIAVQKSASEQMNV
jgi:hypothetical protein